MTHTEFATLAIGQRVRFIGSGVTINTGAIGTVTRMDDVLTDCPVVYFPKGTFGPYSEFLFTNPAELEPVQTDCHVCGLPIAAGAATESWHGNLRHARGTCPKAIYCSPERTYR